MTVSSSMHVSSLLFSTLEVPLGALFVRSLTCSLLAACGGHYKGKDPARQTPMLWASGPGFSRRKWTLFLYGADANRGQQKSTKNKELMRLGLAQWIKSDFASGAGPKAGNIPQGSGTRS
ncbi:hypothetical protein BDP55DRAFT_638612 [Colletotrichum godetiae]|uniref:Uncharacterized protein n=1 Tax=Colletotrichum godetiae TaxID=1209918 RepID=A0AAJ0A6T9_9PEZI|nr:uncharacterized protein BDP55DRAFT_638612 [Colletotrichum godetiae]KAK1657594.1 hypothetical protein BDP55DRAFT_638612 [Colletotrichum godetiae]